MIRVLLTEVTPGAAEALRAMLAAIEEIEVVGYPRDGLEAAQMAVALRPEVLLVHERLPGVSGAEACELVSLAAPQVACVLLCDTRDDAAVKRAMRAGARAMLSPEDSPQVAAETVRSLAPPADRTASREYRMVAEPALMPRTIAVLSARDGVGKSTLCTNLGAVLAQRFPDEVALVDVSGQFSSSVLLLNLKPNGTIMDLAGFAAEVDLDLLDAFLVRHHSGLRVLAGGAKPDPTWTDALSVDFIATLLGLLRRRFRFVLCDMPTLLWPGSLYVITRAQCCLAMTSLFDITGLQEIALLIDSLAPRHVPPERLKLLVSRAVNHDSFGEDDIRTATRRDVWHRIPNDTANVLAAAAEGEPLALSKPTLAFSRSIAALADMLVAQTGEEG